MKNTVQLIQIIVSVLLMLSILLQARGTGLGATWGGGGETFRSKRGIEKILFRITIILTVLFLLSSFFSAII